MTRKGLVHFIHGKESGPGGRKLVALSEVAGSAGWRTCSLDYSHTTDPAVRLEQLLTACRDEHDPLLLAGSSMGGWVAAEASRQLGASGLFLLAPAVHMAGYPSQAPIVPHAHTEIVHGWDDDVIPYDHAVRFARSSGCTLHLVQGDHRLSTQIPLLCELFASFLRKFA